MDMNDKMLPAVGIAGEMCEALDRHGCVVVTAPPGAGKSTVLPLALIGIETDGMTPCNYSTNALSNCRKWRKVLMLEPRRLAARHVAERMAWLIGERVGQRVGYSIRFERCVSDSTQIEVLTEGLLARRLVNDPFLEGVDVVVFDEFHERSLHSDVALCMVREAQAVRNDLRVVVMSATIDAASLSAALQAPVVSCTGRQYAVEMRRGVEEEDIAVAVAKAVRHAVEVDKGDILAFLPGEGEIRRCCQMLDGRLKGVVVMPLYGRMPIEEQRRAIAPASIRRVVLATAIAETSLTIEGVRVVVDSGWCREVDYSRGMGMLMTRRVSMDMAVQRMGRAGRVAPGVCYRLYSLATESRMAACRRAEILDADLAGTLLLMAACGYDDVEGLSWIERPPAAHVAAARRLLTEIDAIDGHGRITPHGMRLAAMPCHPRIAQMLWWSMEHGMAPLAADVAAQIDVPDRRDYGSADFSLRIDRMRHCRSEGGMLQEAARQYCRIAGCRHDEGCADPYAVGALLSQAFADRICKAWSGHAGVFLLPDGEKVWVDVADQLAHEAWVVAIGVSTASANGAHLTLAAPLTESDALCHAATIEVMQWDNRQGLLIAAREWRIGQLTVQSKPLSVDEALRRRAIEVICNAVGRYGSSMLSVSDDLQELQQRVATVAGRHPELSLPDIATDTLFATAAEWLPLYIGTATTAAELRKIDLRAVAWAMMDYGQQRQVELLAPSHIVVPTGSRIKVEYRQGRPVLRVRLQECFGMTDTPLVDGQPVLMELLSPGFKPVQLTADLRSFWQEAYYEVRKELRRRYPKHAWPDNPLEALPVRGVERKK